MRAADLGYRDWNDQLQKIDTQIRSSKPTLTKANGSLELPQNVN